MKKYIVILLLIITQNIYSQEFNLDRNFIFNFQSTEIIDIAVFYKSLITKNVFVDVNLIGKKVTGEYQKNLTRQQTLWHIQRIFSENGIDIIEYENFIILKMKL